MTCRQIDRLEDGRASLAQIAEIRRHAAECPDCAAALEHTAGRIAGELRDQIDLEKHTLEHLDADVLMNHADGSLHGAELETARAHLENCAACRSEVEEIQALRRKIQPRSSPPFWTIAASVAAAIAIVFVFVLQRDDTPARAIDTPPPTPPPSVEARTYSRADWQLAVTDAKRLREFPVPAAIERLYTQKSTLRGASQQDSASLTPDGDVVISSRPRLQWTARKFASYKVILQTQNGIVESPALTEPAWTPATDLAHGREYRWQVEITAGGVRSLHPRAPDPPARFKVLEQSAVDEIAEARTRYPDDPLLHAVILAKHGARTDALQALDQLEGSDPELARALRESLMKWPR